MVVSDKMDKTIVISVTTMKLHKLYKKYITRSKRVKAHDEENSARVGDKVRIVETRPLSKEKRWRLFEIVERAK
jgi:small subunit ribosomal protein S17